jgi:hypothetical protein
MASRELPPPQPPQQQSPQQQSPQQQPTVYPKIAEDQPDTEEQLRGLINQGHSPGAAQAIVSGQEPKTLSGAAPKPKAEPAKPSEQDNLNDTLLKSEIARSLDTDRLDDPRVIAEFNRRKGGGEPQTSGSETGAKSPKIQLPSPGTGDQAPTTIDGKRIYGTATSFGLNYDGSIDADDNGRGFFGGVNTRNPNLKAVAVPVDVLEKTFGHFAQLNSKGGYDALDTPEAKAIIRQIQSAHVELPDPNGKIHKFPIVDIQGSLGRHPGKVLDLTYGAAKDMGFSDNHAVSYQIVGGDGKPYPIPDIELTGKGGGEGKGKGKGGDTLVPMVPSETNAPAPAQTEVPLGASGGTAHISAAPEAAPSQGGWFGGIPWPFRGRTPQAQAAQTEEEEEEEQTPLTTKLITRGSSQPRAITDTQNILPGASQSAQLPAPAAPAARPQSLLPPPAAPSSLPAQPSAKTVELSLLQKPELGKVQPVAPAKPKTLLPAPSAPAPKKPIAAAKAPVPPAKAPVPPATTAQPTAPAKGGIYTGGAPPGSTHGQANPPAFKALSPGTKLPEAVKEHARLVSEDDPRVKKQKDGAIKGEHFVEGDPIHDQLLGGLPEGKHGPQRQMLAQAEQAIAEKRPMHISYLSAPKEAQRYPTRESRTVQYEEHTPEARLMGTTVGQLVGHSFIPTSVGVSLPRKAGEPHQSYIQGISTNILANNFGHLNEKLAALGLKTPYKSLGNKFYNDLEGYYSNLNAGHTATGRGHALGTEDLPNIPDPSHVPYKLKRREADFINTVINNTMAFAGHEDAQKLRELAKANGTLITPEGETNRMRHHIEQHDPGWRNRVLEPSVRSFKTGLIVAHHQDERYFPETIRPGKEFQNLTRAIQNTSEQGRPDVPIATSLHHTYQDNAQINKIERDFSDHKIDEAEAHRRLEAMGEDPDEYRFVGGSGGLVTPYEDDPEAITPEEHTQMKHNLREQWINGKIDVEKYRQKAAEVPLPTKPAGFAKGGLVKPQGDPDDLAGQTVSTTAAPPATPPPDQDDEPPAAAPTKTPPAAPSAKPQPSPEQPEAIRAAAVHHVPTGKITEGFTHYDAAVAAERRKDPNNYEVGFTTNKGRFVDRDEAHQIAKSAKQVGKTEDESLAAEDLGRNRLVPEKPTSTETEAAKPKPQKAAPPAPGEPLPETAGTKPGAKPGAEEEAEEPEAEEQPAPGKVKKTKAEADEEKAIKAEAMRTAAIDRDKIETPEDKKEQAASVRLNKISKAWVKQNPDIHPQSMHAHLTGARSFPGKLKNEQIGEYYDANNPKLDYENEEHREHASDAVVHDVMHSLAGTTTGGKPSHAFGWYSRTIRKALKKAGEIAPKIATDKDHDLAFKLAWAITSQGQDVFPNTESTWAAYHHFVKTGRLPESREIFGGGLKAEQMEENFAKINKLWHGDENNPGLGSDKLRKMLMKRMTVGELAKQYPGLDVGGELAHHTVNGAMMLGAKIGAFFSNLNGDYDPTTMDLWFSRNMNLMAGNMFKFSDEATRKDRIEKGEVVKSHLSQLRDVLNSGLVSIDEDQAKTISKELDALMAVPEGKLDRPTARALAPEIYKWARQRHRLYQQSPGVEGSYDESFKTPENLTAKKLDEGTTKLADAPRNGTEREWWRDIMRRAGEKLKAAGVHLTNADKQALLWFDIKDLFKMAGSPQRPKADYLDAMHALVYKVKQGKLPSLPVEEMQEAA